DIVVAQLEQALAPEQAFPVLRPVSQGGSSGSFAADYSRQARVNAVDLRSRIESRLPPVLAQTGFRRISFDELKKDASLLPAFVAQLDEQELATLARGEGMLSEKVTKGIAAAFGGVSERLHSVFRIPCAGCSDGPSGIRMDTGKEAHLMPSGTNLACSWNVDLIEELYAGEGLELLANRIDALLGPGINIQRNPLGGRNFEYFSEDPLVSGLMACAEIAGLRRSGAHAVIKHFAANNQESARREGDSVVSERALREIYLRPFEIAVKQGKACAVMSSYNSVNGHWAASNYDLVNTILRREWGFDGLVMTDWWACMNDCVQGGVPSIRNTAAMIRSGNNVYMVVDNDGAETNVFGDNIGSSLAAGSLTLGELQRSAMQLLSFLLSCRVAGRELGPLKDLPVFPAKGISLPDGGRLIQAEQRFVLRPGERCYIDAVEDACYTIRGEYRKDGDTLSQSVINILVDGGSAASFQCRTTMGTYVCAAASKIELKKGLHENSLVDAKP
ncbi:MAG: beta-glucosidase, partial [Treponema sp.]|nr:beta-glucosidase [Treponema sp.]